MRQIKTLINFRGKFQIIKFRALLVCSYTVAAGDQICGWGYSQQRGFGGQKNLNLVDTISCILVLFGDGHYLKNH